jgi:UDPglucose 6-dehydrogenase
MSYLSKIISELYGFHRDLVYLWNVLANGTIFLGGPTAAVIALQNPHIRVTVVDKDAERIARWNSRHLPVQEPGLYEVVRAARDGFRATSMNPGASPGSASNNPTRDPNLFFSTDITEAIAEADIILLSVNTPTKMTGVGAGQATNMAALESAVRDIALTAKPRAIVVEKSTVPCRTAQMIRDTVCTLRLNARCSLFADGGLARGLSTRRSL